MTVDQIFQPVMKMIQIPAHDLASAAFQQGFHLAAPDGQPHIAERDPENQQQGGKNRNIEYPVVDPQGQDRADQSQEQAAGLAQKDFGRMEIENQKARTAAAEQQRNNDHFPVAGQHCQQQKCARGNHRIAGAESVQTIDQVKRIQQRDAPEDRQHDAPEIVEGPDQEIMDPASADPEQQDRQSLEQQFFSGSQSPAVIHDPGDQQKHCRREKTVKTGKPLDMKDMGNDQAKGHERQGDRDPAAAHDRIRMIAIIRIPEFEFLQQKLHRKNQKECQGERFNW